MNEEPAHVYDWDRVVATYVKIRDARAAATRAYEENDRTLAGKLETLENFMLNYLNNTGMEKFSTSSGTAFKVEEITPSASDWTEFYAWIAANDAFDALERRIKRTFITAYMEQHKGEIPPGVSVFRRIRVNVRRSSKRRETLHDADDSD